MRTMLSSPSASLVSHRRWPWTVKVRGRASWKSASQVVLVEGTSSPMRVRAAISEPVGLVDHVAQRLAGQEAAAIVGEDAEAPLVEVGAEARGVRGDEHARPRPQRVIGGQRLLFEHVE